MNAAACAARLDEAGAAPEGGRWLALGLTTLGVVFGDIGTSPLYAFRECFLGLHAVPLSEANVLGVLSLMVWSLIIVISIKYLVFVMQADNRGEGGIIALVALLGPISAGPGSLRRALILLGVFGAALLYADGTITPAISVLSAIEGLKIATPVFEPFVLPLTVAILVLLFALQRRGTAGIGALFGPITLVWFVVLGLLGLHSIIQTPAVLAALSPVHALHFFAANGLLGFLVLGTVFLVVTGGEALYADMGHVGRLPIRAMWFAVVLPGLVLNYLGQGALVLRTPAEIASPFYHLAPDWALYPMVVLATAAIVIASQAVITGAFSLTRQAIQIGFLPRLRIVQTHGEAAGQIYVPAINWFLMVLTIGLVLGFQSSGQLASAYGLAVSIDMVITTILAAFVACRWKWNPLTAALVAAMFLVVDLAFLGANLFKVSDGGWYPLTLAASMFFLMSTWRRGSELLRQHLQERQEPLAAFIARLRAEPPVRVEGTAVFLGPPGPGTPVLLLHHLKHNRALHERVVLFQVEVERVPRVPAAERLKIEPLDAGLYRITAHYGFAQSPDVPLALRLCEPTHGLAIDLDEVTYYVGHQSLLPSHAVAGMWLWRERLYAFMHRNAAKVTDFYDLPPAQVVELGIQVEI
jgi:KUP system potassium uptake protein